MLQSRIFDSMSDFRFTYDGAIFEAPNAPALVELWNLLRNGQVQDRTRKPKKQGEPRVVRPGRSEAEKIQLVVSVLEAVESAPKTGIESGHLVDLCGLDDPKALGPLANLLRNRLKKMGLTEPHRVFRIFGSRGKRYWRAGPDIATAIAGLKKAMKQEGSPP